MSRKRLWVIGAAGAILALDAALLASQRMLFVHSYHVESVTYGGDIILPASAATVGPDYSPPYSLPICVYWTGLSLRHLPWLGADECPWVTP